MMFVVLFSPEEILCPWCFKRYFLDGQLYGLMPRKSSTDAVFAYEVVDVDREESPYREGQRRLNCAFAIIYRSCKTLVRCAVGGGGTAPRSSSKLLRVDYGALLQRSTC